LSTVFRFATGTPFTVLDNGAPDILFLGDTTRPRRPICVDQSHCSGSVTGPGQQANMPASAFRHARYGDTLEDFVGRNTFRTDGGQTVDAGLYKTFRLPSNIAFMLRLDVFNVFNSVRWWFPNLDFNSPSTFGTVTQTAFGATGNGGLAPTPLNSPRTMQLGFRLIY
jgi:hypothetical protein